MSKIIYNFTNIPPHYRSLLWEKLLNSDLFQFHVIFGSNKSLKIKEIDFSKKEFVKQVHKLHKLKNFWVKGSILIWQSGVIKKCFSKKIDTAIFLGEFQVISTWIAMLICKFRGIQVVYWTHGIYGNESFFKMKIRVIFYKTANKLLVYERRAKRLLVKEGINEDKLVVIYNSLNYDLHLKIRKKLDNKVISNRFNFFENNALPYLIFVGRLTEVKKNDMLIDAVARINKTQYRVNLLFIGEGVMKVKLQNKINNLNLNNKVHFYGACYKEEELANFIYSSSLCVSPGNIGLTAVHSMSFGTPVCTHSNFLNQMPEVEIIEEGVNGCFFEENNIGSLVNVITNWVESEIDRELVRTNCYKVIDELYNPYAQVQIMKQLVQD